MNKGREPEGGGLVNPSLTDVVNVREHDSGKDDTRIHPVDLDTFGWGHQYGYAGTGVEDPVPEMYTGADMREDLKLYAQSQFEAVPVKDQAGIGRDFSFFLNGTMESYLLAGADWARKRVRISTVSTATGPLYIGTSATIERQVGGNQSLLWPGQERVITHTEDVWVVCDSTVTPATAIIVSVSIERYERRP